MKDLAAKLVAIVMITALTLSGVVPSFASGENKKEAPEVTGTSAILIDAGTGQILYEKNSREKRDPASITKILNCLVVLENMDLDSEVKVPYKIEQIGNNIDLKKGEVLTVEQLLYAMMICSANDAAEILAVSTGGSIEEFCRMMNERAAECGAENTNFTNPNGLNGWGQENHRTTAYDLAMIAREAMKNQTFRKLVSTVSYTIPATNKSKERTLESTDPCIYPEGKTVEVDGKEVSFSYEGMTGIKTGSTGTAGECFCGSAKRGGTELIGVSLNAADEFIRFTDVTNMLDYGFDNYFTYTAVSAQEPADDLWIFRGDKGRVKVGVKDDLDVTLDKGQDTDKLSVDIVTATKHLKAPVSKDDKLGTAEVRDSSGQLLASADVYALEDVKEGGPLSHIGIADEYVLFFITGVTVLILAIIIIIISNRRRREKKRRQRAERLQAMRERDV